MNKNIKYSQNFLTSEKVLNQIIKQLNLKETDTVGGYHDPNNWGANYI